MSHLARLEALLTQAERPGQPFSPEVCAANDRAEAFPSAAAALLDEFGLPSFYVPAVHGGQLHSFAELVQLWRAVARRDLTAAVGHGKTFLGAVCVWVANDAAQASRLGEAVAKQGLVVSWGLTERHHGSDLLAGELSGVPTEAGWSIEGEKWLINNATRGQVLCALARTDATGGPRGFSLFLMDKRHLPAHQYACLPKEPLHGIRGADISGIRYRHAQVRHEALVGQPGQGIEIVLKALQLSRTACVALSLGAADAALKLAHDFCAARVMHGQSLLHLPLVRRQLGELTAGLLMVQAVSVVASRAVHALPAEMSVIAPLAKALVPSTVDQLVASAGEMLGARAYLRDEWAHGRFQKLERDHRIVAIFDGSTVVNRNSLINQFRGLNKAWQRQQIDATGLALACDVQAPLPAFDPTKLSLLSSVGCSVLQSWPQALAELQGLSLRDDDGGQVSAAAVLPLATVLDRVFERVMAEVANCRPDVRGVQPEAFALARDLEGLFAAAACLQLWLHNQAAQAGAGWWRDGVWLQAVFVHLLAALAPDHDINGSPCDQVAEQLVQAHGHVNLLSDWTASTHDQEAAHGHRA